MSDKSGIEWTDATWNPTTGCTKVSQGCKHCYAEKLWPRMAEQEGTVYTGRQFTDVQCHPERLAQPLHWARPRMIFVNSMSDLFHEDVPDEFIDQVFAAMALADHHTFLVLTKRPERMRSYMQDCDWGDAANVLHDQHIARLDGRLYLGGEIVPPLPNVWLGVSVENQATADERIPVLLDTPAAVRFISAEPLLGAVTLERFVASGNYYMTRCEYCRWVGSTALCNGGNEEIICPHCLHSIAGDDAPGLDWVIAGGESGPGARPMHPAWARSLRDQCAIARVPFFFKQWGAWAPWSDSNDPSLKERIGTQLVPPGKLVKPDGTIHRKGRAPESTVLMSRLGKRTAGAMLDGREHKAYPVTTT